MTFADDLSNVEPADNFDGDEVIDPSLLDGQLLPLAVLQSSNETAEATDDLRNISWGRRVQLGAGKSVKLPKLRLRSWKMSKQQKLSDRI